MTALLTLTDDVYSANNGDGRKRLYGNVSLTNPYTAGGETISFSTYFSGGVAKFDGGVITMINPSVSATNAGIASTGKFRGDNSSTGSAVLQLWNTGLTGTANAGLLVDNTVANLSSTTFFVELIGR